MARNSSFQDWINKGESHCTFALTILKHFFWNLHKDHPILGSRLLYFFSFNVVSKAISTNKFSSLSSVKPHNVLKWGKHVLTHLCGLVDLCVSCKCLPFKFGIKSHYPFSLEFSFRKTERIFWLKRCYGIIVTRRLMFHAGPIKDQTTMCEMAVITLLINKTVLQRRVRDVDVAKKFIIVY